ncbi:DUF2889 domain-containing protein [Pseudoduganella umbonata]|uniref:DUF2889 domain-containing protein n=1 Tax=Pseudoduganella umbonata TaxID=864828 RepID=A0A4V1ED60_9BURK|nr:DUF2889 domain-containing protein [Pseudoduganella umbonata]MBB3219937.1 hypothetical protein [Pseudoduganella umbonata]QCP09951.1 DUF2889 domain-containing protein [Pseudoduganella umbonata]
MQRFRRRIELAARRHGDGGEVRAVLEDDFHHFRVVVGHRGGAVTAVRGETPRHPFSACPGAAPELDRLAGMRIDRIANSVTLHADPAQQCTHMFDLAGLAIAVAARGDSRRRYDIDVPRHVDGRSHACLRRNGVLVLEWEVDGSLILGPAPYAGVDMRQGMARWALGTLPDEEAEAALVLRRCALISLGRLKDLDRQPHAHLSGRCYAQQPERAPQAIRIVGSTWDFSARPEALCQDDQAWLGDFGA